MFSLTKISIRFEEACSAIDRRLAFALQLRSLNADIAKAIVAFCVIKLHDQWNARCRELVLRSAIGNCVTLTGIVIPKSAISSPMQMLRNKWSNNRTMDFSWEPDWHVPNNTERAAKLLGITNYPTVVNAITAITLIEDLRWTRNSIAHELPRTYKMFRQCQQMRFSPPNYCPSDYAIQRIPGASHLVIDSWMDELKLALKAAVR